MIGSRHGWEIVPCQPVVECPGCGFTMGIDHTDEPNGDSYTCPVCAEANQPTDSREVAEMVLALADEWTPQELIDAATEALKGGAGSGMSDEITAGAKGRGG